jgi:glucan biosynthesis protein C
MSAAAPRGRLHHVDSARSFLMLLGVPFHAALIYAPGAAWVIASPEAAPTLGVLADILHAFRMPSFFLLAGLLVPMALGRMGGAGFISSRARRLLVPLAVAALVINTPQLLLMHAAGEPGADAGSAAWFLAERWASGRWVLHLWFLIDLFLYAAVAGLGWIALRHVGGRMAGRAGSQPDGARSVGDIAGDGPGARAAELLERALRASPAGLLALGVLYGVAVGAASRISPALDGYVLFGTVELQRFLFNLPFFLMGMALGQRPAAFAAFAGATPWTAAAAALAIAGLVLVPDAGTAGKFAHHALKGAAAWLGCRVVLTVARTAFDRPSPLVRRLVDASFTIYLLHHLVIVAAGLLLMRVSAPPLLEWAAIVGAAVLLSYWAHARIVAPSPTLRFLLNGVPPPRTGARAREGAAS